jgi:acyl-coenzyme A synthetase/AMP-(fatty) acid ligase
LILISESSQKVSNCRFHPGNPGLDDPETSAHAFRGGWFCPNDLAALNEDGYVFLKGRADDAISNSGVLFYPIEVEAALQSHPAVVEAVVFGWPHPTTGETAVAAVVTKATVSARDLRAYCAERIAPYKSPWRVMFLDELPKDALGKVQKRELEQRFRERLAKQRPDLGSTRTISIRSKPRTAKRHSEP